ncbi:hypothetical protein Tco_0275916 [Tanacetum coccineum]
MPPPDPNNTYTKPPSEIQILEFIKTLGYDEDPKIEIGVSKMVATRLHQPWRAILSVLNRCLMGKDSSWDTVKLSILQILCCIVHSANLDFALLIWDEFEWQTVERSSRPSKMSKLSSSKLHSSQDDHPITKLSNTVKGDYKFGMEIPDTMINDAIKKLAGYKFYMAKKVESKNAKTVDEPKEQHVSLVKSERGKGFMCYDDQVANVSNKLKKAVVIRKIRSLTIVEDTVIGELANSISIQEPCTQQRRRSQLIIDSQLDDTVADAYVEWGHKHKGPAIDDPTVQSLLDLRKGSKASRLKSLKQKKQAVVGEGSSVAHNKYYDSSYNDSKATLYSSSLDKTEESTNEIDDADESDMDLSDDNPDEDDDAARYGVFMHNKSTATPNSTYLGLMVTSSSLDFIQTLLDETTSNELTNFMSHPVYTDAQTTSVVHNPEGNPELASYISGASKVPLGTHVDILATKNLLHEMFLDENAHHIHQQLKRPILPYIPNKLTPSQSKEADAKGKKEYEEYQLQEAFEKAVQAKVLPEMKKLLPTHIPKVVANYVRPRLNTFVLDVMKNNQINLFTQSSTSIDDLSEMDLKLKLILSIILRGRTRRKEVGEPSSISSRQNNSLVVHAQVDTPAIQPLDPADEYNQTRRNPEWYTKSGSAGATKKKTTSFDLLLKSDNDQNKNHILGPSTVAIVKKLKAIIQKDELTIADLEGVELERLKRSDDKEYEFSYADLPRLSLNDVEDMYLLQVQDKLYHLLLEFMKDFNNALLLFIKRVMIHNRVEDIQLGVESYQQTLNTKPMMCFEGINQKIPFTMSGTHKRVMYLNEHNVKSFMKLSEGRDWTDMDVEKSNEMVDKIDKVLKCKEHLRRLKEYVGGRPKTVNPRTFVKPV